MKSTVYKKQSAGGLIGYFLKGSIALYLISVLCSLLVTLLNVLIPQVIGLAIDSVIGEKPIDGGFAFLVNAIGGAVVLKNNIWIVAVAILILALGMAVFRYIHSYTNVCANEKLMQTMRDGLFFRIQRLPLSWHTVHRTGDIIQRCTSDTQTILNFISNQMMHLIRIVTLIVLSLVFMFVMQWQLALIAAVFVPIVVGYSLLFYSHARKKFRECDEQEGVLSTIAQENLTGARVVRGFGRERYERDKFNNQNVYYTGLWVRLERFLALFWTSSEFLTALQLLCIIAVGTVFCINGNLTEGEFVAFVSYNTMLIGPVRQLGRIISNMSKAKVSLERIGEIMNGVPEEYGGDEGELSGDIVFKNVSFSYEQGKPVLKNINLTVPQGSTLGIIGGTGSGKSTLTYLLDGLYSPDEGEICIGGKNINGISLKTLRKNIGLVLQEGYVYSKTVGENISIASESNEPAAIRHAAQVACVDENIQGFERGYDTVVGERGVTLSGGQKQRVCIARTLMRKTPVLIFDDSLSAVDSDTDAEIRKNLSAEWQGATVIIISHRVTTVMNADNIIVMEDGKISESGTNSELLEKDGVYRRIYDMQMSLSEEIKFI
ncbi:MAG: ABC transporter ATP-binding protein [Clostridiales bacterium]|nr:ABC transporter ATP-binding protein [Clostridiales bacterium]